MDPLHRQPARLHHARGANVHNRPHPAATRSAVFVVALLHDIKSSEEAWIRRVQSRQAGSLMVNPLDAKRYSTRSRISLVKIIEPSIVDLNGADSTVSVLPSTLAVVTPG